MTEMNPAPSEQSDLDSALSTEEGSGRSRRLLFVLGGAAVVVLALGGFFLMNSGGSGGDTGGSVVVAVKHNGGQPKPAASGSASPSDTSAKPPVYSGQAGRNPFKPLAGEQEAVDPSASASDSASSTTGGTTTTTSYQVTVTAASESAQTASFWVNGTEYKDVAAGDTFAGVFRLDTVASDSKGTYVKLTYGDVAIGQKLYVRNTYITS